MFSRKCEYALKAMIYLASQKNLEEKFSIHQINKHTGAPPAFMAKVLQDLVRADLLHSIKGPGGGFFLDEQQRENSIASIIVAIDGDNLLNSCLLGLKECSSSNPCPLHNDYVKLRNQLKEKLSLNKLSNFNGKELLRLTD